MNAVFLDTVGLIAVWDLADQWNTAADAAYQIVIQQGQRLATTPLILWECGNAAARRPFRQRVNTLRHYLLQESLLIEPTGIVPRPGIDGVAALTPTVPLHTNPKRERGLTQVLAAEWEKTLAHASG